MKQSLKAKTKLGALMAGVFGPLRGRDFRRLYAAQAVSMAGDGLIPVALSFAVISLGGGAGELGLVLGAQWLAMVAFVMVGGVWADRLSRKRVLVTADLARFLAQGLAAALLLLGAAEVWHLVALQAVHGTATAFSRPAAGALVPRSVSPGELQQANALLGLTWNSGAVVGPALGGALVVLFEPGGALAAQAITYAVAAGFALGLRSQVSRASGEGGASFFAELRGGLREVGRHGWMWWTILVTAVWLLLTSAPFRVLGPLIAERELGGAAAWATILAAQGIGGVAGSTLALGWKPHRPVFAGTLLLAFQAPAPALLALAAPIPLVAAATFFSGLSFGVFMALWDTAVQQNVPDEALGRVGAIDWAGSTGLLPLGYAIVGPAVALLGEGFLLWQASAVALVLTLVTVARRDVRTLRRRDEPPSAPQSDTPSFDEQSEAKTTYLNKPKEERPENDLNTNNTKV